MDEEDKVTETLLDAKEFLTRNRNTIIAVAAAVVVVIAVSALVLSSRARAREQIQVELSEALILMQTMEHQRAALLLESLLERHSGGQLGEDLKYHCATAQFLSGNYARALELFQALDANKPKDRLRRYAVREGIGNCYEAQGEFARAAEFYERLAEKAPEQARVPAILAQAARCYEKAGNLDSVERLAARLMDDFGENEQWRREGARLAARARTLREAGAGAADKASEG